MGKYILKTLLCLLLLFLASFIIYTIMRFLPTSYVETQARQLASLPGRKAIANGWRVECQIWYGCRYTKGYSIWLSHAFQGDFGILAI